MAETRSKSVAKTTAKSTRTKETVKTTAKPKKVKPQFETDDYVVVKNGFNGKLIYISKRSGEVFVWDSFGDEQEMQIKDLLSAKASAKEFFQYNYFLFDDPAIPEFLGVSSFYKHSLSIDDFETFFEMQPEEAAQKIKSMPSGQKSSLAFMARKLFLDGEIDSIAMVDTLEKTLGIHLKDDSD